ncbi:MAG: glycosyltransferase family 2 protein [Victivallaceae bacterium]|nr:glycosyltransferase family 2 protein [Victivallaceae bacterium]
MRKISIVGGCRNEERNLPELYERCMAVLRSFPQYDYEFVIEDNCSTDGTRQVLRALAARDRRFKVIFNANNFGHIRSPYNALLNASGDAVVLMCTDLQEPPEVISDFIKKWEQGVKVVAGVRSGTKSGLLMESVRKFYYALLQKSASGGTVIRNFTGFGLYDRCFIEALRKFHEPYPYFRGLVSEIGFSRAEVPFVQDRRRHGRSNNDVFTLYDMAMTGFVNHSRLPLRLAALTGFIIGAGSFITAMVYLILKLCMWNTFQFGLAPMMIGMFFLAAVQLIFIGVIGEYLGAVWTQVKNRPLVVEEERLNFDEPPPGPDTSGK